MLSVRVCLRVWLSGVIMIAALAWGVGGPLPVMAQGDAPSVLYSSYLGGNSTDEGKSIALDSAGNIYVMGETFSERFLGREITIGVDLALGSGKATVWTCDLTHGYISINADYRS